MSRFVIVRNGATHEPVRGDFIVAAADVPAWARRGGPLRALLAHDEAAIVTPDLCQAGRPFALAVLARLSARGTLYLVDEANRRRPIRARDLARWASQMTVEPFTRSALVRRITRQVDEEFAALERGRRPRLPRTGTCAYFRTDLSFGIRAGGSVGHIAGVINNLPELGFQPVFVTTDRVPTIDPRIETHLVCASERFWTYRELPAMVMDEAFGRAARGAIGGRALSFIYQRYSLHNFTGVRLAREAGVPLVIEYNGSESWVSRHWGGRPLTYEQLSARVERLNFAAADLIVVVSDAMRDQLVETGVDASTILVDPNGVDVDRYSPSVDGSAVRARLGIDAPLVLGFIGTFGVWHGADVLASAYDRLLERRPDLRATTRLLFIGDGAMLPRVQAAVEAGGARGNVIFTGLVPQADGPPHLAACDVLVSPHVPNPDGTPFFGSPTKLFEYMAMGRPIVASDLDQIGQVLRHGDSAWLVAPADVNALADGLARVVDDAELRRRLAARARADAVARHSWRQHTRRIVDALERVTASPRAAAALRVSAAS